MTSNDALALAAISGDDPDEVPTDTPAIRRALARSAERALRAGRRVSARGLRDDALLEPASCRCHAIVRTWEDGGQHGEWVLPRRPSGLPATTLIPVQVAAQIAVAIVLDDAPWPRAVRPGPPLDVHWVHRSPTNLDPDLRAAIDESDLADAVVALADDETIELTGPWPACASIVRAADGWRIALLFDPDDMCRDRRVHTATDLPPAIRSTVTWVAGGGEPRRP